MTDAQHYDRQERARIADEARELWARPDKGQVIVKLSEAKLDAICALFRGLIYTDVSGREPYQVMVDQVMHDLAMETGRATAVAEAAADKRAKARRDKSVNGAEGK